MIWRVTTDWRGSSTVGLTLPMRVTVPPLRTRSMAVRIGAVAPTASKARSAPRPEVKRTDTGGAVGRGRIEGCVSAELQGGVPARRVGVQGDEDAGRTCAEDLDEQEPDESGSNHDDGIAEGDRRDGRSVGGDGGRFRKRCVDEIESFGHGVDYPLRHDHIFGEGAGAAVFGAGDAEDSAVVAEIDIAPAAVKAFAAVFGRIEGDAVSGPEARDTLADGGDFSRGLMAHDDRRPAPSRGAVHAVDVGAADRRGPDSHQDVVFVPQNGVGNVFIDEFIVFFENKGFHADLLLYVISESRRRPFMTYFGKFMVKILVGVMIATAAAITLPQSTSTSETTL